VSIISEQFNQNLTKSGILLVKHEHYIGNYKNITKIRKNYLQNL